MTSIFIRQMSVRKVSRGESLASPRKRRFSRTLPNFALITIVMILMMMMMVMMMMMIINYCRLTASEARNRRTLNPLVELWREDLFITPEQQYTQALGCSSSECTSKGKSVFITVHHIHRTRKTKLKKSQVKPEPKVTGVTSGHLGMNKNRHKHKPEERQGAVYKIKPFTHKIIW